MSDNRAAIRHEWANPQERIRYIRRRIAKRENTPGVSWSDDDHNDIAWLCDLAEELWGKTEQLRHAAQEARNEAADERRRRQWQRR